MGRSEREAAEALMDYKEWAETPAASESEFVVRATFTNEDVHTVEVYPARLWEEAMERAQHVNASAIRMTEIYGDAGGGRIWATPMTRDRANAMGDL
ncbi:hypothetical protein [Pseudoclavibacter terrae]|uniref:Uncharacterized protein n=1 Tax=Pseudoclavibacter terrae TaxID=1530195 RepID=A0A7J5B944_9MICO|nr:hypothetical protein [Pseudoclavibacter terrae]KAB1639850.1 hypothetical protein F8O03_05950 [Pseudoclavibacter terrae]